MNERKDQENLQDIEDVNFEELTAEQQETETNKGKSELEETKEKLLRLHADFDNFKKRTHKEREEWYQYASIGFMEKLLPVMDNLERAIESIHKENQEVQGVFSGIQMIYNQLKEVLEREGLHEIEAVGKIFDPIFHEAIMQVPVSEGQEENLIVEQMRKGYCFKDKVLRPSLVKVAKDN